MKDFAGCSPLDGEFVRLTERSRSANPRRPGRFGERAHRLRTHT